MGPEPRTDLVGIRRWRNGVYLAFVIGGVSLTTWGPRIPAIIDDLGIDTRTAGVLLGCVAAGSVVGFLSGGAYQNRLGARRGLLGATSLITVALLSMASALAVDAVPLLAIAFLAVGLGISLLDVLINVEGSRVQQSGVRPR